MIHTFLQQLTHWFPFVLSFGVSIMGASWLSSQNSPFCTAAHSVHSSVPLVETNCSLQKSNTFPTKTIVSQLSRFLNSVYRHVLVNESEGVLFVASLMDHQAPVYGTSVWVKNTSYCLSEQGGTLYSKVIFCTYLRNINKVLTEKNV